MKDRLQEGRQVSLDFALSIFNMGPTSQGRWPAPTELIHSPEGASSSADMSRSYLDGSPSIIRPALPEKGKYQSCSQCKLQG